MARFFHDKGYIYISHKYKLIYIPIPKNGSTSIRKIIPLKFTNDSIFNYIDNVDNSEYKTITTLRDPMKRFVSSYIEVNARSYNNVGRDFIWIENQKDRFYSFLYELKNDFFDPHLFPQYYLLTDYKSNLFKVDYFMDFENLSSSFNMVINDLGIQGVKILNEKVYVPPSRKLNYFKFLKNSSQNVLKLKLKSMKGQLESKIAYKKYKYDLLLSMVHSYSFKKHQPDKNFVFSLINDDKKAKNLIRDIYYQDFNLINRVRMT